MYRHLIAITMLIIWARHINRSSDNIRHIQNRKQTKQVSIHINIRLEARASVIVNFYIEIVVIISFIINLMI